jgi:hypothetical protein
MAVLWAIPHCFGVLTQFLGHVTLNTRFRGDSKLIVFAFYGHFVGYSTLFWGPGVISRPRDSRYTVKGDTKNSSFSRFMAVS